MSERAASPATDRAIVWHDVECGAYDADLRLWEGLVAARGDPILELGAGTGRVSLHLARRGHAVVAVEREPVLAAELERRAREGGLAVDAVAADARTLALGRRVPLILAPMQFLQLFGEASERRAVLEGCRAHLVDGGILAAALLDGVPDGTLPPGEEAEAPLPDIREVDGFVFSSTPLGVSVRGAMLESERRRQLVSPDGAASSDRHVDRLALLTVAELEAEAREVGLEPAGRLDVAATDSHVGSTVSILEARG